MNDKNQAGGICESGEKRLLQNLGEFTVFPEQIAAVFQNIRQEKYLIHMIPNTVSASLCADGLAALGARPLMAVAPEEMEEIAAQADSCVVNLGQLNQEKTAAAETVLSFAAKEGKPIVVDPVGCGLSAAGSTEPAADSVERNCKGQPCGALQHSAGKADQRRH